MPVKPKPLNKEEQYFITQEVARLKRLREEHLRAQAQEDRRKMKELHFLCCAKCGQKMETTKLESVEIEICPDCGGIYLDAGELGKIVDEKTRGPFSQALAYARKIWDSA